MIEKCSFLALGNAELCKCSSIIYTKNSHDTVSMCGVRIEVELSSYTDFANFV
jgi:hypothetical protein